MRLTNEQLMAVDKYYWDGLAMGSLYQWMSCWSNKIKRNNAWIERTRIRMSDAIMALEAIDSKDQRAVKDANTEIDNCTKLLVRLGEETRELETKYATAERHHSEIYARILSEDVNGIIARTSRAKYTDKKDCC